MSDISALYAEKLAKLIRIPTVTNSDRQNFVAFRKTLAEEFPAVYRECEVIRPGGEGARAEEYRPQLEAYSRALERVTGRKVFRRVLWFFATGQPWEL